MNTNIDINQLLQKPVAMMTGEELFFLLSKSLESKNTNMAQSAPKGLLCHRRHCSNIRMQCPDSQPHQEKWCHRQSYHSNWSEDCYRC